MPLCLSNHFIFSFTLLLAINSILLSSCYSINVESQTLLTWKNTLMSATDALKSWNSSVQSPCNWVGIRCDTNGHVVKISLKSVHLQGPLPSNFQPLNSLNTLILSSVNLTGPIPPEFGDYHELTVLDIGGNSVTGQIPVELCKLKKLQVLSLNTNFLQGAIPVEIGNLSSLVYLMLFDNQLSGVIPKGIGNLKNLEVFRAGGNQNLTGELPWEIGNCSKLVMLGMAETGISGILPSSIGMLKRIQTIAIYTARLSGPIPDEIANCSELMNLYLYQNTISGLIPTRIGELKRLQSLLLWQNTIVGNIPSELGSCSELEVVDLSENLLTGSIPSSFGGLVKLEELQLSVNRLSGNIPSEITNCRALVHFEVDNNEIMGEIPSLMGILKSLTLFFAWQNRITGNIPESLSQCKNLQALDLSYNQISGPIPRSIFALKNLTKLLLLSNNLSGIIPPDIGNCTNLYRFRVNDNKLEGTVPLEIANLQNLNFLDMSKNHLIGGIPPLISRCENLEFLDLHSNRLTGSLPENLPRSLEVIDISENMLSGSMSENVGLLTELTKLNLGKNQLSGRIPGEILSCSKLQLLDLGNNGFSGEIPKELGQIPSLEISLNLSSNQFTGQIPAELSQLTKLGILDLSHNKLTGNLDVLATLENLVSLNISFNNFSGELPNTSFFHKLPLENLAGNQDLHVSSTALTSSEMGSARHVKTRMKLAMSILVSVSAVLVLLGIYVLIRTRMANVRSQESDTWELTFYQKMEFSVDDIVRELNSTNVIGTGSSGVVYRVTTPDGETLAVKKMWSVEECGAFTSEIKTLGLIRHRNIVRLLGWGTSQSLKLLFYDFLPNGSLSSLLHGTGRGRAEWETRYNIVVGVAHALAYLHHDCDPAILHGDVKAMNVLLGSRLEPCLADFGLSRIVYSNNEDENLLKQNQRPQLAGSYGYMPPEHGQGQSITEKSDVYSFGVVVLEVLTGRHPLDPTLPGGAHLVQWVRDHLQRKGDPDGIIDPTIRGRTDPEMHEMLQTLAVSFLCISTRASDRPTMKDVVAMLKEIRNVEPVRSDGAVKGGLSALPASLAPTQKMVYQGSSNCSFSFSDDSV